jgi:GTP-binding protein EngB required for normal cell division
MADLLETLDLLDLAVARAAGVAGPHDVAEAARTASRLRRRRDYLGDYLMIALAGGTGAGKSSLLNAIAGEPIASTSEFRPHTDEPLAWAPEEAWGPIGPLLDELAIERRVPNETLPGVVLVDLPDLDSVAAWHRRTVEQLLPRVDAVVWVFDPVKYHDPVVHEEFLRPLATYRDQFIFVLNKIDRIEHDVAAVSSDLTRILGENGYVDPNVFATSSLEGADDQRGIGPVRSFLTERLDAKRVTVAKIAADIRSIALVLAHEPRIWDGSDIGYSVRPFPRNASGSEDQELVNRLAPLVGEPVAQRLRATLGRGSDEEPDGEITSILWDRAVLAATLASLGVSALQVRAAVESGS